MSRLKFGASIADATIAIVKNGAELSIGADGIIGVLPPNTDLEIVIRVPHKYHLESFCAHRDEEESVPTYEIIDGEREKDNVVYRFAVSTIGKPPKGFTKWPKNQMYVISKLGKGSFRLFQISLASQDFRIFLRRQLLYEGSVVLNNGRPAITDPYFKPWNGLDRVIIEKFRYQSLNQAPVYEKLNWNWVDEKGIIDDAKHIPHYISTDLQEGHGRADYFTESKGTGGAVVEYGGKLYCVRLYYGALPENGSFRTIKAGQLFTFTNVFKAKDGSWEVEGVRLI